MPNETVQKSISDLRLLANQRNAQKSTGPRTEEGKANAKFNARRHGLTGQFYCMSEGDEKAYLQFQTHLLTDLKPIGHYESQLAISIVQDQWRLNRARAIENNIFAIGMSAGPIADATDADSPEVLAAACQARVWLADGKHLQTISLYEHRIRRNIEKNEKQLKEIQAERNAPRDQALEEALLIAEFALSQDEAYDPAEDLGENRFEFLPTGILRLAHRRIRLQKAIQYQKQTYPGVKRRNPVPFPRSKAA